MKAGICHIVCAAPCKALRIDVQEQDLLIAADGGYEHCLDAGLKPDIFIGDMDSLPAELAQTISCEQIKLPCEKDDTDTIAACRVGLERGYKNFQMHASLGGDIGHEIANLQLLAFLHQQEAQGELVGDEQNVRLVTPETSPMSFAATPKERVSLFAFGGEAQGVHVKGLHWELENATLTPNCPIGVSNYAEGDSFEIAVKIGALLVVTG